MGWKGDSSGPFQSEDQSLAHGGCTGIDIHHHVLGGHGADGSPKPFEAVLGGREELACEGVTALVPAESYALIRYGAPL